MSQNQHFTPGEIRPLSASAKKQWALGQVRQIATGAIDAAGLPVVAPKGEETWSLSIRSIEREGNIPAQGHQQVFTLLAGDFLQLNIDGSVQGLEPLRPLKFTASEPVPTSAPQEELLVLHLDTDPAAVRGTVRIVELSKQRPQYLFDGQFGVFISGQAQLTLGENSTKLAVRDTVTGSDVAEPTISGRGFLAVVSLDLP